MTTPKQLARDAAERDYLAACRGATADERVLLKFIWAREQMPRTYPVGDGDAELRGRTP